MKKQTLSGVIRQRLSDYEARLNVGVRQWVLVDELQKEGFCLTIAQFRNELYRARKKIINNPDSKKKNIVEPSLKIIEPETKAQSLIYPEKADPEDLI